MLTPEGRDFLLGVVRGTVGSAVIRVFQDDETFADAPLDDGFPAVDGGSVLFQATFGGDSANFHWTRHAVVVNDLVLDSFQVDLGIKAEGSVWTLKPRMELVPQNGD